MSADSTGRVQALQAAREEARDALQQQALKHAQQLDALSDLVASTDAEARLIQVCVCVCVCVCACVRACVVHSNMCLGVTPIHVLIKGENELLESKVKTLKGQQQMNGELRRQLAIMQVCVCVCARAHLWTASSSFV